MCTNLKQSLMIGEIKTREEILAMSDEEARAWIDECEINTPEHIRRHNLVWYDYGLSRLGILIKEPANSGELTMII